MSSVIEHVEVAFDPIERRTEPLRGSRRLAAATCDDAAGTRSSATANGIAQRGTHGDAAIPFVFALDDLPRRVIGAGVANRAIGRGHEPIEHLPVPPRVLADAPAPQRILFPRLEPLLLRRLPEVHPELQDDRAIVGERALEGGDLVEERRRIRRW